MVFDAARARCVVFGGLVGPQSYARVSGETWTWDGSTWTQIATEGPAPRVRHAMAYDEARAVVVLFGGYDRQSASFGDTWEWNGTRWEEKIVPGPPARRSHTMAFDSTRGVTVLFGGYTSQGGGTTFADTWEWDGERWRDRKIEGPSRLGHAMTFDPARRRVVLFGGAAELLGEPSDHTWEYDGNGWSRRTAAGPSPRSFAAMTFDSARNVAVLTGRYPDVEAPLDMWEWDGSTWRERGDVAPATRYLHAVAFDTARSRLVLFGGARYPASLSDTWEYDGSRWIRQTYTHTPFVEDFAVDPVSGRYLARTVGGIVPFGLVSLTWVFDGTGWDLLAARGPGLNNFASAFDARRGVLILQGGFDGKFSHRATWEFDGTTWRERSNDGPRAGPMVYEQIREVSVVLEGLSTANTWEWEGKAWTMRATAHRPPTTGGDLAFDSERGVVVYFTQSSDTSGTLRETWEYDGNDWALRSTDGPPARARASLAYHAGFRRTILHGGWQERMPLRDTWAWDGESWSQLGTDGPLLASPARYDPRSESLVALGAPVPPGFPPSRVLWHWGEPEFPLQIIDHPDDVVAIPPEPVVLSVEAVSDAGDPTYQWRRDGIRLTDNSRIQGSSTSVLRIDPTEPSDTGLYDAVVSNACETVISASAAVSTCAVDWNHDARINSQDFFDFLVSFFAGDADFDGDGSTDTDDLFNFLSFFLTGCV